MKTKKKVVNLDQDPEYQKYVEGLCDPNYQGGSWSLPENPTPLQIAKRQICRLVVSYKQDENLTTEQITEKIGLSKAETEDILYYRIDYFTLDRLMAYVTRLFSPLEIRLTVEKKSKNSEQNDRPRAV